MRQSEREQQRTRAIVRARGVVRVVEQRAEDDLRDVVAARRELVEHQVLARHRRPVPVRRLLDVVERARDEHVVRDPPPVEPRIDGRRAACGGSWVARRAIIEASR